MLHDSLMASPILITSQTATSTAPKISVAMATWMLEKLGGCYDIRCQLSDNNKAMMLTLWPCPSFVSDPARAEDVDKGCRPFGSPNQCTYWYVKEFLCWAVESCP